MVCMADLYVIIAGIGGEIVLILPATIYFLFLLCVVNGVGGHSPVIENFNYIAKKSIYYCLIIKKKFFRGVLKYLIYNSIECFF